MSVDPIRPNIVLKPPSGLEDLDVIYALDYEAFGSSAFPKDLTGALIQADPTYFLCIWVDGQMIGYMTLYPVTDESAVDLITGTRREAALDYLKPNQQQQRPSASWYVPDLVIAPAFQGHKARFGLRMFTAMLAEWVKRPELVFPCRIYALTYSNAGARFLARNHFAILTPAENTADGYNLVGRTFVSKADAEILVKSLNDYLQSPPVQRRVGAV